MQIDDRQLNVKHMILDKIIEEVMNHILNNIKLESFTLTNGFNCTVETFFKPRNRDGIWEMGIDVRTDNDALDHIEFVMERTGLGGNISKLKVVDNK